MNILDKEDMERLLAEYGVQYTDCLANRLVDEIRELLDSVIDRYNSTLELIMVNNK